MWAMAVVVPGVTPKDALEMPCIDDEEMIQALGPDEPFRVRVGVRRPKRVRRIWAPSDRKTWSKLATYVGSRSRTRNFTSIPSSTMSPVTFLACWVTQAG
jgi:hypothetical protein